jgi:hypothetical protein
MALVNYICRMCDSPGKVRVDDDASIEFCDKFLGLVVCDRCADRRSNRVRKASTQACQTVELPARFPDP